MNFKIIFLGVFFLLFSSNLVLGQGEIDTSSNILITDDEHSGAIFINTNGWGLNYLRARRVDGFRRNTFEITWNTLKHPKEFKSPPIDPNAGRYVYGKLNSVFVLKSGVGRQREIFSKFDKGSLSIKFSYQLGAALAFLKPVYFEIDSSNVPLYKKFDRQIADKIIGSGPYLKGFGEIKINPGAYLRSAFTFDYSKNTRMIYAMEVGFSIDAYLKEIEIMSTKSNPQFFITLNLAFRFGVISENIKKTLKENQELEDKL